MKFALFFLTMVLSASCSFGPMKEVKFDPIPSVRKFPNLVVHVTAKQGEELRGKKTYFMERHQEKIAMLGHKNSCVQDAIDVYHGSKHDELLDEILANWDNYHKKKLSERYRLTAIVIHVALDTQSNEVKTLHAQVQSNQNIGRVPAGEIGDGHCDILKSLKGFNQKLVHDKAEKDSRSAEAVLKVDQYVNALATSAQ